MLYLCTHTRILSRRWQISSDWDLQLFDLLSSLIGTIGFGSSSSPSDRHTRPRLIGSTDETTYGVSWYVRHGV